MNGEKAKAFHTETRFEFTKHAEPSDPSTWPDAWKQPEYKSYPRLPFIKFSTPNELPSTLQDTLFKRLSSRDFNEKPQASIPEKIFGTMLYFSLGINDQYQRASNYRHRFYPSSGGRFPIEAYVVIQNVAAIEPGIYHYSVQHHGLELLTKDCDVIGDFRGALFYEPSRSAAAHIILTAVFKRNFMKYGDRGYRYTLMEAGHIGQNIALTSAALDLKCCNTTGFRDSTISAVLDLDPSESPVYMAVVGA